MPALTNLHLQTDAAVTAVFQRYPEHVRPAMQALRALVLEVAGETEGIESLQETLKWGEPSYLTKHGSTLRMDWKLKSPDQVALYFKCTSRLVETFRALFADQLTFAGNRAIVFQLGEEIPRNVVKLCIQAALQYHRVKKLPTLGISTGSGKH